MFLESGGEFQLKPDHPQTDCDHSPTPEPAATGQSVFKSLACTYVVVDLGKMAISVHYYLPAI